MDDNHIPFLQESQYEWALLFVNKVEPAIYQGIQSMFCDAVSQCKTSPEKYLMTFQTYLLRIPKWNEEVVSIETARIIEVTKDKALEDLLTSVHICLLKILSSVRAGRVQKKVTVDIPKLSLFIHKTYIKLSTVFYNQAYLFKTDETSLQIQKNRAEQHALIRTAILNTIRDNMPIEQLLRVYLDATTDLMKEDVHEVSEQVETKEDTKEETKEPRKEPTKQNDLLEMNFDELTFDVNPEKKTTSPGKKTLRFAEPLQEVKEIVAFQDEVKTEVKGSSDDIMNSLDFETLN
jgi:hypothetical protein